MINFLSIDTSHQLVITYYNGINFIKVDKPAVVDGTNIILEELSQLNINYETLSFIVFINGPGSFTGLRIGCSVVQALSFRHNIKVLQVSSLMLKACSLCLANDIKNIKIQVPALNNEYYYAEFSLKYGVFIEIKKPMLLSQKDGDSITSDFSPNDFYKNAIMILASNLKATFSYVDDIKIDYIKGPNIN
jgi:tRNA threonylcarbamoyl adenosine modification protein YeaZ